MLHPVAIGAPLIVLDHRTRFLSACTHGGAANHRPMYRPSATFWPCSPPATTGGPRLPGHIVG